MKKIWLLFALLFAATASPVFAAEDVVYVDFDRIYRESKVVGAVSDDINVEFNDRNDALEVMNKNITDLRAELQKDSLTLSDSERNLKASEIAALEREFVRERRAYAEDRGLRFQERRVVIDGEIERIIEEISKERGYSLVLNPYILLPTGGGRELTHSIILYADDKSDITEEVIKRFDQDAKISR